MFSADTGVNADCTLTTEDKSQMLVAVGSFCVQCKVELTGNCNSEANLIANSGPNNKTSCMVPAPDQHVSILMLAFSCKQCGVSAASQSSLFSLLVLLLLSLLLVSRQLSPFHTFSSSLIHIWAHKIHFVTPVWL